MPGGERYEDWVEVPPGHFIAGKSARLQQFALTPEQLYQREVLQSQRGSSGHMEASQSGDCAAACGLFSSAPTHSVLIIVMYESQMYESHMEDEGSPPPASPTSPGRVRENSSLSSVHSSFDADALFRIDM